MAKKKTYNPNLVKKSLNYSVKDIAKLYKIHKRTVQEWFRKDLPKIDDRKPNLVLGYDLSDFIRNKQQKRKRKCLPNQFYCCKCREPRNSWNNLVDVKILNEKSLMIMGICALCKTAINKIFPTKRLTEIQNIYVVQRIHNKDLVGSNQPIVKTDIKRRS